MGTGLGVLVGVGVAVGLVVGVGVGDGAGEGDGLLVAAPGGVAEGCAGGWAYGGTYTDWLHAASRHVSVTMVGAAVAVSEARAPFFSVRHNLWGFPAPSWRRR